MKVKTKKVLALLFAVFALSWATQVSAQGILAPGELIIDVTNPWESTWITVEAVSVVWGKWQNGYPVRTDLGYYQKYTYHYCFDHIGSDDLGLEIVGYGRYKITIDSYSTYVDYRDCDYQGEDWPGDYFHADINVTYNKTTHTFTRTPSSGNIWSNRYHPGNKDITQFKIPVTATNNFSGGQIKMDGTTYTAPKTLNWGWTTTHTITAISPQYVGGEKYTFQKWSDGNAQLSRSLTIDDQHNSYTYTANFTTLDVTMSGPSYLEQNQVGTFTAQPSGGIPSYDYTWYRMEVGGGGGGPEPLRGGVEPLRPPIGQWVHLSWFDGSQTATSSGIPPGFKMCVDVTDHVGSLVSVEKTISVGGGLKKLLAQEEAKSEAPAEFALHSNYPNPFNPETAIGYDLAEESRVILSVYNLLGEEVKRLVDANQPAGTYTIRWDGTDGYGKSVSGGLYITKMEAVSPGGRFVQTGKMLLLK